LEEVNDRFTAKLFRFSWSGNCCDNAGSLDTHGECPGRKEDQQRQNRFEAPDGNRNQRDWDHYRKQWKRDEYRNHWQRDVYRNQWQRDHYGNHQHLSAVLSSGSRLDAGRQQRACGSSIRNSD
jgi:hypothetical protein